MNCMQPDLNSVAVKPRYVHMLRGRRLYSLIEIIPLLRKQDHTQGVADFLLNHEDCFYFSVECSLMRQT